MAGQRNGDRKEGAADRGQVGQADRGQAGQAGKAAKDVPVAKGREAWQEYKELFGEESKIGREKRPAAS